VHRTDRGLLLDLRLVEGRHEEGRHEEGRFGGGLVATVGGVRAPIGRRHDEQEVSLARLLGEAGEVLEVPTGETDEPVGAGLPEPRRRALAPFRVDVFGHA